MKKFMCCAGAVVLLLLVSVSADGHGSSAPEGVLTRQVQMGRVTVETRALSGLQDVLPGPGGRRLLSRGSPVVFLLGYDPAIKASVSAMLASVGASLLQPMPPNHWLVRGTPAGIRSVQEKFPSVTSSVLPKQAKTSEGVEQALAEITQSSKKHIKPRARELGEEESKGKSPSPLDDLVHYTKDGHTWLELSVDGPALSTVLIAYGPDSAERRAAKAEAEAWAQELQAGLAASLGLKAGDACQPAVQHVSILGVLRMAICTQHAADAASWLADQGSVIQVGLKHALRLRNLHGGTAIQSGAQETSLPDDFVSKPELFPFWKAGISGQGQVVGVSDSGIDMGSCYFWDPDFKDYQTNQDNIRKTVDMNNVEFEHFFNADHRKVISYYKFLGDWTDDEDGHGTHVAGTVAGAAHGFDPVVNPDLASGVAPNAKLSFFDNLFEEGPGLVFPGSCDEDGDCEPGSMASLFELHHKDGARIASASWGSADTSYVTECVEIDALARQRDMLILVAAGNSGDEDDEFTGRVEEPATCKNVLAIGAADNWRGDEGNNEGETGVPGDRLIDDDGEQITVTGLSGNFSRKNEALIFYGSFNGGNRMLLKQSFGGFEGSYRAWENNAGLVEGLGINQGHQLVMANPFDACEALIGDYSGKVVLFNETSECGLGVSGQNINNTDALAGIFFQQPGTDLNVNKDGPVFDKPFTSMVYDEEIVEELLDDDTEVFIHTKGGSPSEHVTFFSSYGPTLEAGMTESQQDVRIAPQLIAPGVMLSAGTDGTYDANQASCTTKVTTYFGTSMACPAAAGAAALARQYFVDGFYPTGEKVAENAMEPTASLLTAVLVAGAASMTGIAQRNGQRMSLYDVNQGFGRVDLSRSLPLSGVTAENWRLQVWQGESFEAEGETQTYEVVANGEHALAFTLAWLDLPGEPGIFPVLTNDLDMKVTAPDGTTVFWGNKKDGGDRSNNIEKIVIDNPVEGAYAIEVKSVAIAPNEGGQKFSVVALGGVTSGTKGARSPTDASPPPSNEVEVRTPPRPQVDVEFTVGAADAVIMTDIGSTTYRAFKMATEGRLAGSLRDQGKDGARVELVRIFFGGISGKRRSLLDGVQDISVVGRYRLEMPSGTSEADSITAVNRVLAEINTAGTDYFRGLDLGGITLRSVRAALASGANKAHMAWGTLLSAVLSVVLLLAM